MLLNSNKKYTKYCIAMMLNILLAVPSLYATEPAYVLDEKPPANSADEIEGALSSAFRKERLKGPFFPILKEKLKNLPPFIRDTKLGVNIRTF